MYILKPLRRILKYLVKRQVEVKKNLKLIQTNTKGNKKISKNNKE